MRCPTSCRARGATTRSLVRPVSYDDAGRTRDAARRAVDAGFGHLVLSLPAPHPAGVARWVADEVVTPSS